MSVCLLLPTQVFAYAILCTIISLTWAQKYPRGKIGGQRTISGGPTHLPVAYQRLKKMPAHQRQQPVQSQKETNYGHNSKSKFLLLGAQLQSLRVLLALCHLLLLLWEAAASLHSKLTSKYCTITLIVLYGSRNTQQQPVPVISLSFVLKAITE